MEEEELKSFCKKHNGTELIYRSNNFIVSFKTILLMDPYKGFSIKILESPWIVYIKCKIMLKTFFWPDGLLKPSDEKFCLMVGGFNTYNIELIEKWCEEEEIRSFEVKGADTNKGQPICPM